MVEGGLIYVNTEPCVNAAYEVQSGDIITMNSEAFWEIAQTKVSRHLKGALAVSDAPNDVKRNLLKRILVMLQKQSELGVAAAVKSSSSLRVLASSAQLFRHEEIEGDKALARHRAKPRAPGGTQFDKYDVYNATLSGFSASTPLKVGAAAAVKGLIGRLFRRWDTSTNFHGGFFYRYCNTVVALRDPSSAKEFFSTSRKKMDDLYNP
ncbi:MAG: hypothetical protein JSS82_03300 [Bacteroidetes bacterium]|nr:hypothetical protein [Bacteroidota bacterium]